MGGNGNVLELTVVISSSLPFFFLCVFRAVPVAYGGSQARG